VSLDRHPTPALYGAGPSRFAPAPLTEDLHFATRAGSLDSRLVRAARHIGEGGPARIYTATAYGFDTHVDQATVHAHLLADFATGVRHFYDILRLSQDAARVALFAFSEFGRSLEENISGGTEDGGSGTVFVMAPGLRQCLWGQQALHPGAPTFSIDFRTIYAALLEDWLEVDATYIMAGHHDVFPLFSRKQNMIA
jgi:uncharacterized protein (DUF1501 family)